jgi:hypothetical protein
MANTVVGVSPETFLLLLQGGLKHTEVDGWHQFQPKSRCESIDGCEKLALNQKAEVAWAQPWRRQSRWTCSKIPQSCNRSRP